MKETLISFFSNLIAVILGIIITFTIQGMIDRAQDRRDIDSALRLIRTELSANREDIRTMCAFLEEEQRSADYILENRDALDRCPADSVAYHMGNLLAQASITLSHDALELLKVSSLFQKIGNNDLSMKIIRAYDTCSYVASALNQHFEDRDARFQNLMTEQLAGRKVRNGANEITDLLKSDYGIYSIRQLSRDAIIDIVAEAPEIDEALTALEACLER